MLEDNEYIDLLNDNLAMLRAKAALTQGQLADIIGIPRTTYAAIENRKRKMTFPVFIELSRYFLSDSRTAEIMPMIGLSGEVMDSFFYIKQLIDHIPRPRETRKAAAFGGGLDSDDESEKHRRIEKALKEIDR